MWQRCTNELFTEFNYGHLIIHHMISSSVCALCFSDVNVYRCIHTASPVSWMVINTENVVMKLVIAYLVKSTYRVTDAFCSCRPLDLNLLVQA